MRSLTTIIVPEPGSKTESPQGWERLGRIPHQEDVAGLLDSDAGAR